MRVVLFVLAGLGVLSPSVRAQGFYLEGAVGQRTVDLNVAGTLSSALNPSTPTAFVRDASADAAVFAVTLGYDWAFGPLALGISAEGSFAEIDEDLDPVTVNSSVTQTIQFCFPPPPGVPPSPPCTSGVIEMTREFSESQTLNLSYEEEFGGALRLEAGYNWDRLQVRAHAGRAYQRAQVNYSLPETITVQGPVQTFAILGAQPGLPTLEDITPAPVTLPAESGAFEETLEGWTFGVSLFYEITTALSAGLSYDQTDFDAVAFGNTARVNAVTLDTEAQTIAAFVRWRF